MISQPLIKTELQGLFFSGYGRQKAMGCMLLQITDRSGAKTWLETIQPQLTFFSKERNFSKLNIAFSFTGLEALGVVDTELMRFSREFREGMVTPHRQRILGDLDDSPSDPARWLWGGPGKPRIDILLLVYEGTNAALTDKCTLLREGLRGLKEIKSLTATSLRGKEHFGFQDGIAQPIIEGLRRNKRDSVAAGEFILGQPDETGIPEPAPEMARHGSYLVLRQLGQNVPGFWEAMGPRDDETRVKIAAKMMGRWPDGTPLTLSPERPSEPHRSNDFLFGPDDLDGSRCPFGAHIRRANPRDGLVADAKKSLESVKRHRILRRGRPFGAPVDPSVYPDGVVVEQEEALGRVDDKRGLLFVCLNASISRQFEFVQNTWLNNPKFLQLASETDPIACPFAWQADRLPPLFTIQAKPVRKRVNLAQRFVHSMGGAYFFLPSRSMLKTLSK